jgi:prepilin-type processing-associated H-X9-DG protein
MRAKQFTGKDIIAAVLTTAFLLGNLALVGTTGRERAKRAVCLANLDKLTEAWISYADDNDGRIVNGEAEYATPGGCSTPSSGRHKNEKWWVGTDVDPSYMVGKQLAEDVQIRAIRAGALFPYCGTENLYHCPSGIRAGVRSYAITDAMNGLYRDGTHNVDVGVKVGETVLWVKNRSEIVVPGPAFRLVFVDEGRPTPESYAVHYLNARWWDPSPVRHDDGTNVSFADGHSEHWTWEAAETVANGGAAKPFYQYMPTTPAGKRDLQRMQVAVWGRLGY